MTRKFTTLFAALAALTLAVVVLAGCGGSGSSVSLPKTQDGRPATLGVAKEDLGSILVNSQGHTLYLFAKDSGTTSSCTGACAVDWPPIRARGTPTPGTGANASLIGTTMRSDGRPQVTYNGHPLYLFAHDQDAGQTNGEGLSAFGGSWYAVSPAGNRVIASSTSPGGGYG